MGMDKKLEKKLITPKRIGMTAGVVLIVALFVYSFIFMDTRSRLNVERDRLTVYTVQEGSFQEFIDVTGVIQPIRTVYIEAVAGGTVQDIKLDSGVMVEEGDTVLVLSNSDLEMNVMDRESQLLDQINSNYNARVSMEQNRLNLREQLASAQTQLSKLEPMYEGDMWLYEQGYLSEREYEQTRHDYEFQKLRYALTLESFQKDSLQMINQLAHLDATEERLRQRLPIIQSILDDLIIKAPIDGQLTFIELDQGQSISLREQIGQVDVLDGFKIRANIDEYYLPRVAEGLTGSFTFAGNAYEIGITRVFPVIENGQFQVDMEFQGEMPRALTRGQTVRVRLELDAPASALLVERGGFYQSTGGNWIYLLVDDGARAVRQPIRLGRGNPQYFEVLEGLQPGDQVVTSSYSTFGDNEVLVLE